jgi:stage II sporulation protein P
MRVDTRFTKRHRKYKFSKVLKIFLFALLSFGAIKVGMLGGSILSSADMTLVENLDVQIFKGTLNRSIPLINTIYNSGNISVSFGNEAKNIIKTIFGFDLGDPISLLNVQSPNLTSYYNNEYKNFLALRDNSQSNNNNNNTNHPTPVPGKPTGYQEHVESSISTNEGSDEFNKNGEVVSYENISIQNETKLKVDINELMKEPLKIKFAKSGPQVLIYHTHTTECYLKDSSQIGKAYVSNRNVDCKYGVVTVGEQLAQYLRKKYDIGVIHNGTINDYPDYNSSYINALGTVNNILLGNPSIRIVIDLHRDGLGGSEKLRAVKKINGKNAAQVMFVMGTNASGLSHPNWRENLKLAIKLQQKLNQECEGLARPIFLSKNRYNQHVTDGALIIEVGGDGNTVDESLETTKYLAKVINEVSCEIKQ